MQNLQTKASPSRLTDEKRRKVAWDNAERTTDEFVRRDHAGREIAWDQFDKQGRYGWIVEYTGDLDADGNEDPSKLRATHWVCREIDPYTAALSFDP